MIFKAVVIAKLTYRYASSAWWGFTTADDRNRMDGLLRRGGRVGFYDGPTVTQIIEEADDRLFLTVLQKVLDDRTTTYSLRSRNHSKVLVNKTSYLNDSDFLIHLLYKYSY